MGRGGGAGEGRRIIDYFNRFPLKTKKQFAFTRWCNVRVKLLNKEHLISLEKFNEIVELCRQINKEDDKK